MTNSITKRYKVALITGTGADRTIEWLKADSPEQLNQMVHQRVRLFRQDAHWKAAAFRGNAIVGAREVNQMLAITNRECRHSITFLSSQANGYLKADANVFVSERGLMLNSTGKWAKSN